MKIEMRKLNSGSYADRAGLMAWKVRGTGHAGLRSTQAYGDVLVGDAEHIAKKAIANASGFDYEEIEVEFFYPTLTVDEEV